MNFVKNFKIDWVLVADAAALNTDANSAILDMKDYDGVVFIVPITDSDATGVATLNVQGDAANADASMATITGATATKTCVLNDDINNMLLIVEVYRPLERYIQGNIVSATANIAFGEMIAIRYKGRKCPITQSTTTVAATTFVIGS
jgi:hypothetical protein